MPRCCQNASKGIPLHSTESASLVRSSAWAARPVTKTGEADEAEGAQAEQQERRRLRNARYDGHGGPRVVCHINPVVQWVVCSRLRAQPHGDRVDDLIRVSIDNRERIIVLIRQVYLVG